MRCPSCETDNRAGARFCNQCAAPLPLRCPTCGTENPPEAKFCNECGAPLAGQPKRKRRRSETGKRKRVSSEFGVRSSASTQPPTPSTQHPDALRLEAERRQLTVMFCDLVGSTPLAERLDPEELRTVILAYQEACAQVIRHVDGYLARYVGDGLLVYFGYPVAHDNDAQRAVQAGLRIVEELPPLNAGLQPTVPVLQELPLQVRIGIHTGLVVVGDMGGAGFRDPMAVVGETPNIAARLQGLATPDTVVISGATQRLVQGLFECQHLGPRKLKGVTTPMPLYRVVGESGLQSRFEVTVRTGLTPLVGRDDELGLLLRCWEKAKAGEGQVVLLSGEAGIGKSRLVQELKERAAEEGYTRIEFRCSPYYQNTALYPVTEHLQRLLQFRREDSPQEKLAKLEQMLHGYRLPLQDIMPLFAVLLSLPHPEGYPPLTLTPQKQKQKTQEALGVWLVEEAERQPVLAAWEDLQWADPSTLELHHLLLDRASSARLLTLLTYRPEFSPPWGTHASLSHLTLSRLPHTQVEVMVEKVTGGRSLPAEVLRQIVAKTDGVPLFVEELTKMVLEAGFMRQTNNHYELIGLLPPLAIPATLHDSLMARLDRLATVKEVAQIGATVGREFSYEVLQAVAPVEEARLEQALAKLVEAEVLYQSGLVPQTRYVFKHALIQDAAYQSLLKSTRQQYHSQIAHVLEERFAETKETQPELLAHHYTEAGFIPQAIPYWQQAGQKAFDRGADLEAVSHFTKGLELLKPLPDTPERARQELALQLALGLPLMATKGFSAPEVERTYVRARELSQQLGETPQLFWALWGLWQFHATRGNCQLSLELAKRLLPLAQGQQDPTLLIGAYHALGENLYLVGELTSAQAYLEQGIALYDPQRCQSLGPGVVGCLLPAALVQWLLGYPDQALKRIHEARSVVQELALPFFQAVVSVYTTFVHQARQEVQAAREEAEAAITLATEHGLALFYAEGTFVRGWALAQQGQIEEGVAQMRHGIAAFRAAGAGLGLSQHMALLAEPSLKIGQTEEGFAALAEALAIVDNSGERMVEAELYRLKGQLTLQSQVQDSPSTVEEAKECFHRAIDIARRQQAKSLELRAVMSLGRLWQSQGKKDEARQMLAEIYDWFTEGFDTKDLQEAKALLEELS